MKNGEAVKTLLREDEMEKLEKAADQSRLGSDERPERQHQQDGHGRIHDSLDDHIRFCLGHGAVPPLSFLF